MFVYWIVFGLIFILFILMFIGLQIALSIVTPKKRTLEKTRVIEAEKNPGVMDFYDENLHDQTTLDSRYGYKLRLYCFLQKEKTDKFMVMAHGHTYTHHGCVKYARMMFNHGYNVVLYDERYHGNSGGRNTTLGYYEKYDLYDVITHVKKRFGEEIFIGTYGESMGAATCLFEQEFDPRVSFVVSDCAFANFEQLLKELFKRKYNVPLFPIFNFTRFFVYLIAKFRMRDVNPIDALYRKDLPILFVHGEEDNFINYHHTVDMYERYQGPKALFIGKNHAGHTGSYPKNQAEYERVVADFLEKYVEKK